MDKQFYYAVGLDLHKNYSQVAVVNPKGTTCNQVKNSQRASDAGYLFFVP